MRHRQLTRRCAPRFETMPATCGPYKERMLSMTSTVEVLKTGRSLLRPEVFDRLVRQIVSNEEVERDYAEAILDQALAFITTCADNPGGRLRPSKPVDIAWHTFILNTAEYAIFCQRVAGRFIHHEPEEFTPP